MQYDNLKGTHGHNPKQAFFSAFVAAGTVTGEEILFSGYDSLTFDIGGAVIANGTFTPKVMVRKKSDGLYIQLTDQTKICGYPTDSITKEANAALSTSADSKKTSKIGVINVQDLYDAARLDIVATGGTVSGTIYAMAVLGHANNLQMECQKVLL